MSICATETCGAEAVETVSVVVSNGTVSVVSVCYRCGRALRDGIIANATVGFATLPGGRIDPALVERVRKRLNPDVREPVLHSHLTDCLPNDHPLAWSVVSCDAEGCRAALHMSNNECMQAWVETGKGNYCFPCFVRLTIVPKDGVEPPLAAGSSHGCVVSEEDGWAL